MEGVPDGSSTGEIPSDLASAIVGEVNRLESAADTPICGGHAATFEVTELRKAFYRNDCLPLRPASALTNLYKLVQEALRTTNWTRSQDSEAPVVEVAGVVRNPEKFLGRSVVLRAAFLDRGSKGWVLSDAFLPVPVTLAAEFGSSQAEARARQFVPDLFADPAPQFRHNRAICVLGIVRRGTQEHLTFSIADLALRTHRAMSPSIA
jgi:hypothetical protein